MGLELQRAEVQMDAVLREIMDGDGYFTCAKYNCRMPVATCVSRQAANAEGAETPFIGCDDCDQGDEIRIAHVESGALAKSKPPSRKIAPNIIPAQAGIRKKEEETMATTDSGVRRRNATITGYCRNCDRNDVKILNAMHMCWQCIKYATGTKGEARVQRLAEAAELCRSLKPGEKLPSSAWRRAKADVPRREAKSRKKASGGAPSRGFRQPDVREVEEITKTVDIESVLDITLEFRSDHDRAMRKFLTVLAKINRRTPADQALIMMEEWMFDRHGFGIKNAAQVTP